MSNYSDPDWAPQTKVDLQAYNTLSLPVQADYFSDLCQLSDLYAAHQFCHDQQLNWLLLGGGSNIVLTDDFNGLVMHMALAGKAWLTPDQLHHRPAQNRDDLVYLCIGAGENWDQLVAWSLAQGAYGLQNLSLIPGLVGAAPIQNIGAYGVELAHILHEVMVFDFVTGEEFCLTAEQCELGYRDSIFKRHPHWIVMSVTLVLSRHPHIHIGYGDIAAYLEQVLDGPATQATPQQVRDAVIHIRSTKLPDPSRIPNVGSFFKNPLVTANKAQQLREKWPDLVAYPQPNKQVKLAAGWLIDQLGWRGYMKAGVGVHGKQALVLVLESTTANKMTGLTLLKLAQEIQADVEQHFAISLAVEPRLFGKVGEIQMEHI
ncbi:MAG: UDP-N-acetylmuramate dehydrogenase [Gammaproteobacteria bacterium]|nr:UDP-N-acetylmuramate dehydrogenase [Gammaproteobacteria bacterium]